jgi:ABC-type antimicrobial peptide transport system permease subunit
MRLLSGRDLFSSDVAGQPHAALVNETLARQFWPGEDPLGKRFNIAFDNSERITVVGVVADVRHLGLNVPVPPTAYRPYPQAVPALERVGTIGMSFVVRTLSGQAPLGGVLRREVQALDPGVPVIQMTTMNDAIHGSLDSPRFTMLLLGLFAGTALLLGAIGVYGVISFAVSEQTHEIGVRIALGADGNQVVRTVVLKGLLVAGAGVVAGVVGALGATRALSGLVFGVGTTDLSTFFLVPLVVMAVAGTACLIPARRASKVDPMVALRLE